MQIAFYEIIKESIYEDFEASVSPFYVEFIII